MPELNLGRVRIVPKGDWDDATAYVALDVVSYVGASFMALKPVPAGTPTDDGSYWQPIAKPGVFAMESRAAAVDACADGWLPSDGKDYWIAGLHYIGQTGATTIPDLPGLIPAGQATPQHWGVVTGNPSAASANVAAFAAAAAAKMPLFFPEGIYCINDTITMAANWHGVGAGKWPIVALASNAERKDMRGSIILLTATPTTTFRRPFMSDMRTSGGVVANGSSINANDTHYRLTDFQNQDADPITGNGATPRLFRVAVHVPLGSNRKMEGIRIQCSFDGTMTNNGHNRLFDYSTFSYTDTPPADFGTVSCGVGVFVDNHFSFTMTECFVVGYWRIAGVFQNNVLTNDLTFPEFGDQGSEYCTYTRCKMMGQVGYLCRGADQQRIIDLGSNWIEVPWADNHPYNLTWTNGLARGIGPSVVSLTFTGTQKIGDRLRLTGVTPNPVTAGLTASHTISPSRYTRAHSNTCIRDGEVWSMAHSSFKRVTELGVAQPSACIEVSGRGLRGMSFDNIKVVGYDDVAMHFHDLVEVFLLNDTAFECFPATGVSGTGMRIICSPVIGENTRVPYPAGSTYAVNFNTSYNHAFTDLGPLFPKVDGYSQQSRFSDAGLFQPSKLRGDIFLMSGRGLIGEAGKDRGILDDESTPVIYHQGSTGDLILRSEDPGSPGVYRNMLRATRSSGVVDLRAGATIGGSLAYTRGNILGGVAQAAGVPTGAVIERGSNADGEYVRFADGTQICTFQGNDASGLTVAEGPFYISPSDLTWTFPKAFIAAPTVTITGSRTDRYGGGFLRGAGSTTAQNFRLFATVITSAGVNIPHSRVAIGRWF